MFNHQLKQIALTLLSCAGIGATGCAGTILYTQTASPIGSSYTAWESESVGGDVNARTYDNFVLSSAADVGSVSWEGIYLDQSNTADNPAPNNSVSFEVSFWSDADGAPGSVLATSTVTNTNPQEEGTVNFALENGPTVSAPVYSYNANLPTPFAAAAGQKYWISILSNSSSLQPVWGWYSGTGGDSTSVQDFAGSRYTRQYNRAFTLEAAPLPRVSVAATVRVADLATGKPGVLTFKISEAQPKATVIAYAVEGNAIEGKDYDGLSGKARIPAGATSVTVKVVPKGNLEGFANKVVKLALKPADDYTVGAARLAVVTIEKR